MSLSVVILISGRGSNMEAIIKAAQASDGLFRVRAVISNRADAAGLNFAATAGIETAVLKHRDFPNRDAFDRALCELIDSYHPGLLVLAGFMRILTPDFVRHYDNRLINIHPSILPAFKGLNTHERALEAGVSEHGATVHFVAPEVDAGPIILQAKVPVLPDDDAETLGARVLTQEHQIYPQAIRWFAEERLSIQEQQVLLDGAPITAEFTG